MIIKVTAHYTDGSSRAYTGNPVDLKSVDQSKLTTLDIRYDDGSERTVYGPTFDLDLIPRENAHTQHMQGAAGSIPPINRDAEGNVVDHSPETANTETNLASDKELKDENGNPKPVAKGKDAQGRDLKVGRA
jgi:hypothetical protein